MAYAPTSRAVSSPIGSGREGRYSAPRRFLPLSQFFLQQKPEQDKKALYGFQEPKKKKGSKGARKSPAAPDATEAAQEEAEGITTTANVPTVPVPIGAGDGRKFLDSPGDKKKRKKKDLPARMGLLLRRLF